jgi:adenylylsulfate kinase
MKRKFSKEKGILFWITGFSGSGKSEISYKIKKKIENKFGKTLIISGDNFRKSFNFKNYDKISRIKLGKQYINFLKIILD